MMNSPYAIYRPPAPVDARDPVHADFAVHDLPQKAALDMHYLLEMGVVLEGRIRRIHHSGETDLDAGGVWFHGVWEGHGFRVLTPPCRLLVLTIWPELLAFSHFPEAPGLDWMAPFNAPPGRRPRQLGGGPGRLRDLEAQWRDLAAAEPPLRPVRKHLALRTLLLDAMSGWEEAGEVRPGAIRDGDAVNRAVELVFSTRGYLSEQEAARRCGLHRNRLGVLFRERMGLGFADFALRHRLSGAARDLRTSDAPLKAVAATWGFTDHSHFLRAFRRHYGSTPATYRRDHAGGGADVQEYNRDPRPLQGKALAWGAPIG